MRVQAANMVIIEVSKACPQYLEHNLLGGHRWRDFLKNPPSDVSDRISGIYYCALHTGREVQKYGKDGRSDGSHEHMIVPLSFY